MENTMYWWRRRRYRRRGGCGCAIVIGDDDAVVLLAFLLRYILVRHRRLVREMARVLPLIDIICIKIIIIISLRVSYININMFVVVCVVYWSTWSNPTRSHRGYRRSCMCEHFPLFSNWNIMTTLFLFLQLKLKDLWTSFGINAYENRMVTGMMAGPIELGFIYWGEMKFIFVKRNAFMNDRMILPQFNVFPCNVNYADITIWLGLLKRPRKMWESHRQGCGGKFRLSSPLDARSRSYRKAKEESPLFPGIPTI